MEVTRSKDVFLKLVIKILVIDFFCSAMSQFDLVDAHLESKSVISSSQNTEIDSLLDQLKTQLTMPKDSSTTTVTSSSSYAYCNREENCTGDQYCNIEKQQCQCFENTYEHLGTCPTVGMTCTSCCCGQNVYCSNEICELYQYDTISSQMILSIVMVMGVVSIIFMVYRMCYRNTLQQRLLLTSEDSQRPSLSSLQIGVMARMRDRPPLYETRHNYQTRSASTETAATDLGVDNSALEICEVIEPRRDSHHLPPPPAIYMNTPPPPYEGDERSAQSSVVRNDHPPPYSVAIKTVSHSTEGGGNTIQRNGGNANYKELYI